MPKPTPAITDHASHYSGEHLQHASHLAREQALLAEDRHQRRRHSHVMLPLPYSRATTVRLATSARRLRQIAADTQQAVPTVLLWHRKAPRLRAARAARAATVVLSRTARPGRVGPMGLRERLQLTSQRTATRCRWARSVSASLILILQTLEPPGCSHSVARALVLVGGRRFCAIAECEATLLKEMRGGGCEVANVECAGRHVRCNMGHG